MTTDELKGENPTDRPRTAHQQWNYSELAEAVDAVERVDWTSVPSLSREEAQEIHAKLREARDELAEETPAAPARTQGVVDD